MTRYFFDPLISRILRTSLILALLPSMLLAQAQELDSRFGGVHTPSGDLHVLVIFIRYDDANLMPRETTWPDSSAVGYLPEIARGDINAMFHAEADDIGKADVQNLSDYYFHMSGGQFRITGDIYPLQVPITFIPERRNNFFSRQGQMNQAAVNWIAENDPAFPWAKYDRRSNRPNYLNSNVDTPPDSILDYVIFMHRAPGSTGMGSSSNLGIPGSRYRILDGHTGIKSYTNTKHNWLYFKHEFAHNLYSAPHYLGANSSDGDRFYTQKGWGLMAAWHAPFFTTNAWESWWLGWLPVQEITESGTYLLKDMVKDRDAIRIRIPGTEDYLWLENHQKIDPWDEKMFFKDPNQDHPQSAAGMYAYLVGSPGADRRQPRLNPFAPAQVNFLRMLHGEGNHDWRFTGDSLNTRYFLSPVMEKVAPNPISGQNAFQFLRADYNGDGKIMVGVSHGNADGGGKEQHDLWAERIGGENRLTIANTGTEKDAFVPGLSLGLSSSTVVTNYPRYFATQDSLEPYILSGISVKVLERQASGALLLDIQMNDWAITSDQRWCGRMWIPEVDHIDEEVVLRIQANASLTLSLSGTPQRQNIHPVTETFAPPTELKIGAGQTLLIERGAVVQVGAHSRIYFEKDSKLVLERGGQFELGKGGEIWMEDPATLQGATSNQWIEQQEGVSVVVGAMKVRRKWMGTGLRSRVIYSGGNF